MNSQRRIFFAMGVAEAIQNQDASCETCVTVTRGGTMIEEMRNAICSDDSENSFSPIPTIQRPEGKAGI